MHEYAFDVKLSAVVRCRATDEATARQGLEIVLDCMDLSTATISGINSGLEDVRITEASLAADNGPHLFAVDGQDVE